MLCSDLSSRSSLANLATHACYIVCKNTNCSQYNIHTHTHTHTLKYTGKAVSVPGKALAAVISRCGSTSSSSSVGGLLRNNNSGLAPEPLAAVETFHAQVCCVRARA